MAEDAKAPQVTTAAAAQSEAAPSDPSGVSEKATKTTTAKPEPAPVASETGALSEKAPAAEEAAAPAPAAPALTVEEQQAAGILPASHWADVATPEDDINDNDSSLGDDDASSTASLTASILNYRTVQGRTYHSELGRAQSWTPIDEKQAESMDVLHHLCTLIMDGKLHKAPLRPDIQKVLDIGTGTGIWAIDMAEEYPSAEITGTDLSPFQPSFVPPNLRFELDDANQEWTWRANTFDFVHTRHMLGTVDDWALLPRQAFRVLKPGGWYEDYETSLELTSDDGTVLPDSPFDQWGRVFWEGGRKFGRTFRVVEDGLQRKGMEEAGFVDIQSFDFKCPIGGWAQDPKLKEIGLYSKLVMETDAEGYILYMWTAVMGWSPQEIQVYLAHLRRQLRDKNVHSYYRHRVVWGRKPESSG